MYNFSEEQIFLIFSLIGLIIGCIFDFFRVLRKSFKTNDFITLIEDISFFILFGIITIYNIIKLNNGEIRLFLFIAIFFGMLIYFLTISNLYVIILYEIMNFFKIILKIPILILKKIRKYLIILIKKDS